MGKKTKSVDHRKTWSSYNELYGSNAEWTVEDGVLTAAKALSRSTAYVIPEGVTRIGRGAFHKFGRLASVSTLVFPEGVTEIDDHALARTNFREIILPQSLKKIGNFAFSDCQFLKTINVPADVEIGCCAFQGCDLAFNPDGFLIINDVLIEYDPKKQVTKSGKPSRKKRLIIPAGIRVLAENAICGGDMTEVLLPDSLEEICSGNFVNLPKLEKLTIPASVKKIGDACFCRLEKLPAVTFAGEIPELGSGLFTECPAFPFENNLYIWRDTLYWHRPSGKIAEVTGNIKAVDSNAFYFSGAFGEVTQVTLPEGVERIEKCAFWGCTGLRKIKLPKSLTYIGPSAFELCDALKEITIPDGVSYIGENAFRECRTLTKITLPESLKKLDRSSFSTCYRLEKVNFPSHMKGCCPEDFGAPPLKQLKCQDCSHTWKQRGGVMECPKCYSRETVEV